MKQGVEVSVKAESLIAGLKGFRQKFRQKLLQRMHRITTIVQRAVKEDKLSGQALHVRSGTLRRSINRRVEETGSAIVGSVGTNVVYAPPHEFGFSGTVNIKEHIRREKKVLAAKYNKKKDVYERRTKNTGFSTIVSAHTRKMKLPEKSFLRSTLKEYENAVRDELSMAAIEALV